MVGEFRGDESLGAICKKNTKKNKQMHVYDKVFQPPVKPREIDFLEWKRNKLHGNLKKKNVQI